MATIEQRAGQDGKPVYRVKIRLKGRPPKTATFDRKTDAKQWAQKTETGLKDSRYFDDSEAKRRTLAEMIDRYLRDATAKPKKSP